MIPIYLIWQIKIRPSQKVVLSLSLCLTVILIAVTIIRSTGTRFSSGVMDTSWQTYWIYISAEVGLILSSSVAFRSFFVKRKQRRYTIPRKSRWYTGSLRQKKMSPLIWTWRMGSSNKDHFESPNGSPSRGNFKVPNLPVPSATGVRTFINSQQQPKYQPAQITQSYLEQKEGHSLPLPPPSYGIGVHHKLTQSFERARPSIDDMHWDPSEKFI